MPQIFVPYRDGYAMVFRRTCLLAVMLMISSGLKAQEHLDPSRYEGDLVAYLTEVNMWLEGHMLVNYCNCAQNEDFLKEYQNVRASYNSLLNSYLTNFGLMKRREAVQAFKNMNRNEWLKVNPELNQAYQNLMHFSETDVTSCIDPGIIPGIVTVAELTAIANSIVDLINETEQRREEQKLLIIQTLEGFKLLPIRAYECSD